MSPPARAVRVLAVGGVAAALLARPEPWEGALGVVYPGRTDLLYPLATLGALALEHLALVGASSMLTVAVGVTLGIAVTRPVGRAFAPLVSALVSLGQTFPPFAVLALMVPLMGAFGFWPTLVALFLYGLLPVVRNTIAGLDGLPMDVLQAARGMGMRRAQVLARVELPLAARVILAGIRTSVVINVGTATIGAAFAAGGLGAPIITGLAVQNPAYVLQGALASALLAVVLDFAIGELQAGLMSWPTAEAGVAVRT